MQQQGYSLEQSEEDPWTAGTGSLYGYAAPRSGASVQDTVDLGVEWTQLLARWDEEQLRCTRCGLPYREVENVGQWRCSQHAVSREPASQRPTWLCCGQPVMRSRTGGSLRGCVPADHTTAPAEEGAGDYTPADDLFLPNELLPTLRVRVQRCAVPSQDASIRWEDQGFDPNDPTEKLRYTVVRRFDWRTSQRRRGELSLEELRGSGAASASSDIFS